MADLIQQGDLEQYGVTVAAGEATAVAGFISSASDAVIDAAGVPILSARRTVSFSVLTDRQTIPLPGAPVSAVYSVSIDGVSVTDWKRLGESLWRLKGWCSGEPVVVEVDYTSGLPSVPADIKDLVCRLVIAALLAHRDGLDALAASNGGVSSVGVDDYREAYATGDDVPVFEMDLPERTRRRLRSRFGGSAAVVTL